MVWHIFLTIVQLCSTGRTTSLARIPKHQSLELFKHVVSGFSLVGNVFLLLIIYLLKLNNISLIGFPHIGVFPDICLNL
jgi:hypothetical protein